jgi:hypothetical protein
LGDELQRLGVRDLSTFGGADVYVPPEHVSYVGERIAAEFGDEPSTEKDDLVGGRPYSRADYEAAGKLHKARKMTVRGIEKRTGLKRLRAYRIYRQLRDEAVLYDDAGLRPGPDYRWDPDERETDPPGYKLIRG